VGKEGQKVNQEATTFKMINYYNFERSPLISGNMALAVGSKLLGMGFSALL
jgi:hypothetical protein